MKNFGGQPDRPWQDRPETAQGTSAKTHSANFSGIILQKSVYNDKEKKKTDDK